MENKYTMIGGDNCPSCATLKSKLQSKGIEYEYKDVWSDTEAMELMTLNGLRSIPQLFLNGELVNKEGV